MSGDLRQRIEPIRSAALRDSARGAPCMLEFPCCNHDPETSVWAHWHDESFGGMRKAHDTSGFPACSSCHAFLDVGWAGKMSVALVRWYVIRAMQRTFVWLIETKVIALKIDAPKPFSARVAKQRKPKGQRKAIKSRAVLWPKVTRKLQGRNDLKRQERLS